MSKFCYNCGKEIADSALFCTYCGSKQTPPVHLNEEPTVMIPPEPAVAAPINPEPDFLSDAPQSFESVPNTPPSPPDQQYYQPPVAPKPSKKNKTAVTVAVCAVILCVVMIAAVAVLFITGTISFNKGSKGNEEKDEKTSATEEITEDLTDRTYGFNIENNGSYTEPSAPTEADTNNIIDNPIGSVPYTKGEVRNGEYINEWAGFKFRLTPEYPEADAATYSTLNSQLPAGEYGFIAINQTSGTVLSISYENNSAPDASVEEIFQSSIDVAQSMLESYNPITYGSIEEISICGEEYLYSTMYYSVSGIYGITLMRMFDGKLISIIITGETLSQCYSFLNTFEPAYPSI